MCPRFGARGTLQLKFEQCETFSMLLTTILYLSIRSNPIRDGMWELCTSTCSVSTVLLIIGTRKEIDPIDDYVSFQNDKHWWFLGLNLTPIKQYAVAC